MQKEENNKGLHVGFIMDGNGRFATLAGNPRLFGHTEGVKTVKKIVRACPSLGITTMSLFAFAIANWKRDADEVRGLWELFKIFFEQDVEELIESGVRVRIIGDVEGIPEDVCALARDVEARSAKNDTLLLQVALNYDGLDEVVRATKKILADVQSGTTAMEAVTPEYLMHALDTADAPPLDVVIRTGMPEPSQEQGLSVWRSSAFMPLQSLQAVCVSSTILWPALTEDDVKEALAFAHPEERLFGGQRKQA